MELRDYLRILWGRKVLIILCVALSAGSALAFSARVSPTYAASAKVFVGPRTIEKDDAAGALQELTMSQQFVSSYAEILKSRPLAELVVEKTNASISPEELTERIETKIIPDTRLIEVTVSAPSPAAAATYANALVTTFVEDEDNRFGGGTLVTASVLERALEPEDPVSPKPVQNGIVGGLLGIMLGIGIAFVLEQLDLTVKTKEDVERIFAPLPGIATVPLAPNSKDWSIFLRDAPNSPESEAIRILRTNIQFFSVDEPVQRVLITSTLAGEGKTTVAVNLAAGIAATDLRVLLIEADLRKPTLKNYFPDFQGVGLSEVLSGQADLEEAVWNTNIPNLFLVMSGRLPPNPSELLGSQRMADILDLASSIADVIILDTPPALPVTDATALAPQSDGVILVVRAGQTSAHKALDVAKNFERTGVRVLGVALNAMGGDTSSSYYYHYAAAEARTGGKRAKKRSSKFDDYVVGQAPRSRKHTRPPVASKPPRRPPAPVRESSPSRESSPVTTPSGVKVRVQSPVPQASRPRVQSPLSPAAPAQAAGAASEEPDPQDENELDSAAFKARLRAAVGGYEDHRPDQRKR
ncbi:MAG: polysaccharide biosynthesis tyrosine autokinase [Actinomycetota bacterium]